MGEEEFAAGLEGRSDRELTARRRTLTAVIVFRGFLAAFFTAFAVGFGVPAFKADAWRIWAFDATWVLLLYLALNSARLAAICLRQRAAVVSLLEARGLRP